MDNHYRIDEDCRLFREMRHLSQTELANKLGLGLATVNRWENMQSEPAEDNLEKFYAYAYRSFIRLNSIKEQFYREELNQDEHLLFHGAKTTTMILDRAFIWENPFARRHCSSRILSHPVFMPLSSKTPASQKRLTQ